MFGDYVLGIPASIEWCWITIYGWMVRSNIGPIRFSFLFFSPLVAMALVYAGQEGGHGGAWTFDVVPELVVRPELPKVLSRNS